MMDGRAPAVCPLDNPVTNNVDSYRNVQSHRHAHSRCSASRPITIAKVNNLTRGLRLGFDRLTSVSVHAEVLPWTIWLPTLELIAVFLLERGQTNRQTRLNALSHAGGYTAGVGNIHRI